MGRPSSLYAQRLLGDGGVIPVVQTAGQRPLTTGRADRWATMGWLPRQRTVERTKDEIKCVVVGLRPAGAGLGRHGP